VELEYFRFLLALVFVLGLIGLLAYMARRFGVGAIRLSPAFRERRKRDGARLAVVDVASIDARRRLVLVRRDDVEHLLLISHTSGDDRPGSFRSLIGTRGDIAE
jgi:flagellar protein FliO/FliZ